MQKVLFADERGGGGGISFQYRIWHQEVGILKNIHLYREGWPNF